VRVRLGDARAVAEALTVRWDVGTRRPIGVATATAVWDHRGMTPVPAR
jgi:hypothetical protein